MSSGIDSPQPSAQFGSEQSTETPLFANDMLATKVADDCTGGGDEDDTEEEEEEDDVAVVVEVVEVEVVEEALEIM